MHGGGNPADDFRPPHLPGHPVANAAMQGDLWERVQVFLLASLVAPFIEEIMFRGVLYRHLREASCRFRFFWSILLSAAISGFIFAAMHPPGFVAVPALMAVAFGLTLVREWRGTLIPGMVTHGVYNGVLLALVVLVAGN
jgi:membrane protease YdiL (CAAX protease family)